ncbi:short-chain-enoyl-CoA hydratase [Desulfosporosinus nitroreducens]|uniref:Short-chain-enoyl-CoA hydratase n=1 Tax=Desulfosporosinus nitroreducens TaxID=2018668 RepID=A0ABT8QSM5_9FIRM|nr:short-chain-enoyl-CoA hydratase [Desulfosporosinus nitroreducens]MCO1599889.1 short-chain-enoyl-CoA hydratase [Desulfosporosinus nitroreducens]MDO0823068.1 short-chain-enoyl-CoA hydratase [Desulfosporosinus nitroreducens]
MEYNNLILKQKGAVAILTINRPKALNALNEDTLMELSSVLDELEKNSSVKVVILTGSGEKAFVAGADIAQMKELNALEGRRFAQLGQTTFRKLELLSQPVIAAVNGFALGGGCELAMACDIRLASETAKFGQPEVTLGITAGFAGTQRLPRLVGAGRASELLFTGDIIDAQEAYRIGLVNHVYPLETLIEEALKLANRIAGRAPAAVQLSKSAVQRGKNIDIDSGQAYEAEVFGLTFSTLDQKEGCSAFLERRKPDFKGC